MDARVGPSERGDIPQGTPDVPFCALVGRAIGVVLAGRSVQHRLRPNTDSACRPLPQGYGPDWAQIVQLCADR